MGYQLPSPPEPVPSNDPPPDMVAMLRYALLAELRAEIRVEVQRAVTETFTLEWARQMNSMVEALSNVSVKVAAPIVEAPEVPVTVEVQPAAVTVERPKRQRVIYDDAGRIVGLEST